MSKRVGNITIAGNANVWPHEMNTARALARDGRDVEFIDRGGRGDGCADVLMDGLVWEMKSPTSNQMKRIQKTLRSAVAQSRNVIFDSRRMKKLPDKAIERELRKWANELKSLDRLVFVGRGGTVLDIK